jgi:hypothetical protein
MQKEPLLIIRTLINNKMGVVVVNHDDEDILITLEHPTADEDKRNVGEYIFDYSVPTTKLRELLDCICKFPEILINKGGYELKFELESEDNIKYTTEEFIDLPINRISSGTRAKLYPFMKIYPKN